MSVSSLLFNIRIASPDELDNIGKVHASALADNQLHNTLHANVDPDTARQWYWIDIAGDGVAKGSDVVLVLERSDTKEIIGLAWILKFNHDRVPQLSTWAPEGFNTEEDLKLAVPRFDWQKKLLEESGEYLYLQEFAIAPAYQSQGLGKVFLRHLIALAERDQMDLALTAATEKTGFYLTCGLEEVGSPLMYGPEDTLEGVTKMIWGFKGEVAAEKFSASMEMNARGVNLGVREKFRFRFTARTWR